MILTTYSQSDKMNKNNDIPLSTLDHLSEDLKPYILYQMTITIPNGSTAKRVEVYTRNESDKEKAIKILDKYKHIIKKHCF